LIEQARAATWQRVTIADSQGAGWDKPFTLVCNGIGQFRYERILPSGLREIGVCDGKTLLYVYPELGIGARRAVSRFHRADFIEQVPWVLPPVDDLARGCDIQLLDANTVRLVPREGNKRAWIETHLVFSYGWLSERRWIEMPSNKILGQEIYATDGTVKRLEPNNQLIAEQKLHRQPAESPELTPDTKPFVVVPFPLRNSGTANRLFNPESKSYAQLDETAGLALMGSAIAQQDHAKAVSIYSERFHRKNDRRVGFLTVLSASGLHVAPTPLWKNIIADYSSQPLGKYVGRLTDPQRPADAAVGEIGGPRDGFVQGLAELHDHYLWWNSDKALKGSEGDRAGRRDRALDYVRRNCASLHGWAVLLLLREKLSADPGARKGLTEAIKPFEQVPLLCYAARYETARDLLNAGRREAARAQFKSLYEIARQEMAVPPIDVAFRLALKSNDANPQDLFASLLRETAKLRMAQEHRRAVLDLAWQCRQLDDRKLADELCDLALSNIPEEQRLSITLLAFPYLWQTAQQERADKLLQQLLADGRFGKEPSLWRLASEVAAQRKSLKRSMECLDTALEMEYRQLPDVIHVEQVRSDYSRLLSGYRQLATAMNVLERPATAEFVARVARAADRWRSLDSDGTAACHAAARIFQAIDDPDLAWDYWTTPIGQKPNEAAPWANLARSLQGEGALDLADRAFRQAFKAEPTNAQLLWDRAQILQQLGRTDQTSSLLRQLADGHWQPQFGGIQAEARRQLGTR
jgi:tetratricopeptide (TPR) repeat protein